MTQINPFVFRQYDIRGKVAQDFPPEVVELLGRGYGTFLRRNNAKSCAISGDVRLTTPELVNAFKSGLRACGINVIDLGMLPTPVNYYSTFKLDVDAAVQVTGSHNPPEFNGFKLTLNRGPVFAQSIQDIRALIEKRDFENGSGTESAYDIREEYAEMLEEKIQLERPIRILLDCGNGAGALLAPEIYRDIGVELECLFCEPDGNFPNHHPDPTIEENLVDLQKGVRAGNFDIGLALDGDADRIGAVDENGEIFWADILMALFVPEVVKKGDQVIFDVKCSQALEEMIVRYGGEPLMTPTGHSILKKKMKDIKGKFAGELSGHIFFADEFFGFDDALYNGLRLARLLSRTDRKLSDLLGDIPKYYSSPEVRLTCENDEEKFRIAKEAAEYFVSKYDCITVDGIRVKFDDGWALARASHTQPDITCRFEATNPDRLKEIEELVTNKLREFGSLEKASGH